MIELIFAIVVMGIVMISIPMLMISNNESLETNMLQEAVLVGATKMNQVLSNAWDENSIDPNSVTLAATQVVDGAGITRITGTDFAPGHIQQPLHRRMTPNAAPRSVSGSMASEGDSDDIDDFHGSSVPIAATAGPEGYKNNYNVATAVALAGGQKAVNVTITHNNPNLSGTYIVLKSFAYNIGEVDYYKRTY